MKEILSTLKVMHKNFENIKKFYKTMLLYF